MTNLAQLAADWRGEVPDGGLMVERKWDGLRALRFRGRDGKVRLWSRNGLSIEGTEHLLHRLALIEEAAGEPMMFDGEFVVGGTLAASKAWFERGWKAGGEAGVLHLFDGMPEREWRAGGSDAPLYQRKARLKALVDAVGEPWEWRPRSHGADDPGCVRLVEDEWAFDAEDVLALARRVWAEGGEGLMLKRAEEGYQRNRSDAWQKVKPGGPWWRAMRAGATVDA